MKRGQFKLQDLIISVLFVGLIAGVISLSVANMNSNYGQDNFNNSAITKYTELNTNTTNLIGTVKGNVTSIKTEETVFDIIGNFINKATAPFRILSDGYIFLVGDDGVFATALMSLGLNAGVYNLIQGFILTIIIVFIFIGIYMFKILLGKEDR